MPAIDLTPTGNTVISLALGRGTSLRNVTIRAGTGRAGAGAAALQAPITDAVYPALTAIPVGTQRYAALATQTPLAFLCVDQSDIAYNATEIGITVTGTTNLIAYGQAAAGEFLVTKAADVTSQFLVAVVVGALDVSALDFGTLAIMPADTDRYGLAKKATQALVNAGIDNETFVTPAQIAARVSTGAVAITGDLNAYTTEGSGYGDASTVRMSLRGLAVRSYWILIKRRRRMGMCMNIQIRRLWQPILALQTMVELLGRRGGA